MTDDEWEAKVEEVVLDIIASGVATGKSTIGFLSGYARLSALVKTKEQHRRFQRLAWRALLDVGAIDVVTALGELQLPETPSGDTTT